MVGRLDLGQHADAVDPRFACQIRVVNVCWAFRSQQENVSELQATTQGISHTLVHSTFLTLEETKGVLDGLPNVMGRDTGKQGSVVCVGHKVFFLELA